MAKSPLAKNSKATKHVRNSNNVTPLRLTIPHKDTKSRTITEFDISHLLHLNTNSNNHKIESRTLYLQSFCKKAKQYVDSGKSAQTVVLLYENLRAFITFCDAIKINPFSKEGYLKYVGNDGELRRRIKIYHPSRRLWERSNGDEIGIKESTAAGIVSCLRTALIYCGLTADAWATQHRGFSGEKAPYRGYSDAEEKILVTRMSELFFTLAPLLIAAKKENLALPDELPVVIDLGEYQEVISIQTSLKTQTHGQSKNGTSVRPSAAFNIAMGAAYHLMCFFTSLNDSNVQGISHPITIHYADRDKGLQVVKVTGFKTRANKKVDAVLTSQSFDVDKRDGVKFIKTLEVFSALYGGGEDGSELLYTLNNQGEKSNRFDLTQLNKHLMVELNLLSPTRASSLPWFKELFYSYLNQHLIEISQVTTDLGKVVVSKVTRPCSKPKATQGATNAAYCILSCYTDLPLKGVLLPLSYSERDSDGNIRVSLTYRNGNCHSFSITAADKPLIQDIEKFATSLAGKQYPKYERLLLKRGGAKKAPKDWDGISPITSSRINTWPIEPNEYFISLQSSRWREMTSNQVYSDSGRSGVQSILQSLLQTIDKHYANGDPRLNKIIISQATQVIDHLNKDSNLEQAKTVVAAKLGITMLAHDEWQMKQEEERAKTNPNGIYCNGQQSILRGKNMQRKTNNAMSLALPCTEYDMCHKCQSAKAVDEVQSIYKLISFIDVLKEALDQHPNAKDEVHEKIAAFELTLDGASQDVYDNAIALFYKNGRHPRVSTDHAILTLYR
ncbi:hypothetical protein C9J12_28565 [Photobacterium frigidiphilum]|uniref:Uncharacterized protein n=1 Tax=Photobacterium frigidiphilum TaxID=264736 RepID=A0A2T3J679_9GAMM|nr:hypothetical protein [Photobacterium frigidiphilum]PSU42853.1 hypothetical protein C9J12_28565 [Photobacterium frigidiphilum]